MISAEMLLRCPRRRFGKRNSLWAPPTQWTMRTISEAASSISATTSWTRVRTMRFLRRASVVGASQTVGGIARCFQIATESIAHLIPSFSGFLGGCGCSGDSAWADNAKQRFLDCIIDAQSSKGNAVRAAIVHPGAAAAVARDMVLHA